MLRQLLKWFASLVLRDYGIYRIYELNKFECQQSIHENLTFSPITDSDVAASSHPLISEQSWYGGDGSHGFACKKGKDIIGICWYWYGARYKTRNFWPLKPNQAKLVQIVTIPGMRSKGIAGKLIRYSSYEMSKLGFDRLYARIWYNNYPSIKTFTKNGWAKIATVFEIQLRMSRKKRKFVIENR